jgi:hypothetical protein
MTRGTYQHYIPAAFIGRFSWDLSKRARSRPVWVRSVHAPRSYVSSASTIAGQIGLYDLSGDSLGSDRTVDIAWGYERALPAALDRLGRRDRLDGRLWVTALVPFVAGLFVRGPEFQQEFAKRIPPGVSALVGDIDNATKARLIDLQVLLAPVMAARWAVVHFPASAELITSDRGYALTTTPLGGFPSYVIPIDPHAALVVTPQRCGQNLAWSGERWIAEVARFDAAEAEAESLNRATAAFARHAVYGPTQAIVDAASDELGSAARLTAGLFEVLDPASHLYDYFRVLCLLDRGAPETQPSTPARAIPRSCGCV